MNVYRSLRESLLNMRWSELTNLLEVGCRKRSKTVKIKHHWQWPYWEKDPRLGRRPRTRNVTSTTSTFCFSKPKSFKEIFLNKWKAQKLNTGGPEIGRPSQVWHCCSRHPTQRPARSRPRHPGSSNYSVRALLHARCQLKAKYSLNKSSRPASNVASPSLRMTNIKWQMTENVEFLKRV